MNYYFFNIGGPGEQAWWHICRDKGMITLGYKGIAGDLGERYLRNKLEEGDVLLAYANGRGFVGVGVAGCRSTYELRNDPFPAPAWTHKHIRSVRWLSTINELQYAVHYTKARIHVPRQAMRLLPKETAERIITLINLASGQDAFEVLESIEADQVQRDIEASDQPTTRKEQLIQARVGQGTFRAKVLAIETMCRLTGVSDARFLIASHIKPWKDSEDGERLDGNNGLMLAPHVDKLFDRGWITFKDNGTLLVIDAAIPVLNSWSLNVSANVGEFNSEQRVFLKYHRDEVFGKHLTL
ncbi:HNH endonuclease [Pseudomonas sp. UBA6310]|uniref:HNH endonuclease n=1 Tax=Pseudomonas sp. UBA6310 TaxID=1947327 RepID=UPI00257FF3AA|nr:HNH endonuclease [Pseudomonas sp. UBA6310]